MKNFQNYRKTIVYIVVGDESHASTGSAFREKNILILIIKVMKKNLKKVGGCPSTSSGTITSTSSGTIPSTTFATSAQQNFLLNPFEQHLEVDYCE